MEFSPPSPQTCSQARLARDPGFDGVFFTAVRSTGIYCRPVCPVPPARERNVGYFATAAQAEAAGFRPCLRCRPELAPADGVWRRSDTLVARALRLIEDGTLDGAPMATLAKRLDVGERHLRRLFAEAIGTSPQQVQATRRLLFAKQLLTDTVLPMADIAAASGFASLRRFNDAFQRAYGMPPSALRRSLDVDAAPGPLRLRLGYRPPFDFDASLAFLRTRALPGIEHMGDADYRRVLDATHAAGERPAWLRISALPGADALLLELHGVAAAGIAALVQRVRRMFDLDADPGVIATHLSADPRLRGLLAQRPGLRIPGGWSGEEVAVRAVLGQQVSVAAATTLARRLVARLGTALAQPVDAELHAIFPGMAVLADADLDGLGITATRARTLRTVARALHEGRVGFDAAQPLETFIQSWTALPGIGDWTAHYIALRGWRHPDAFPAGDLVLRKQLARDGIVPGTRELESRAARWRPWRAYAAIQLWHAASNGEPG